MKRIMPFITLFWICTSAHSQHTITGTFTGLANQKVKLVGFYGFDTYTIDSILAYENGVFNLSYNSKDYGMGYLVSESDKPFFIVLSGADIQVKGNSFTFPETIEILKGTENQIFEQYAAEHLRREQTLSAWVYLEKIYRQDSLFANHEVPIKAIANEKQRIKAEDSLFLAGLSSDTYVSWYLPVRKLVSSVSTIAQYRTEDIPAAIASFRNMDYTDPRLYKSGLLGDVIESHFWLIENSGRTLDSVNIEMQISIDHMVENLLADEKKLNEITAYLFKLLEKRSLFNASEYLALRLLNEDACTLHSDFAAQLESYRAMKKGNTAPDIDFPKSLMTPQYPPGEKPEKLSDIESEYTVVVFGASWCPQCPQELSQMARHYDKWKKNGMEVVFVSLDENKDQFKSFTSIFPFISMCDFQKWESPVVKSYHVFATPTIYLLNNKREIILRPHSVSQLDAWVDWYLLKGIK